MGESVPKRHPEVSVRKSDNLDRGRSCMNNQVVMDIFFAILITELEFINPFVPNAPFHYPLKTENRKILLIFWTKLKSHLQCKWVWYWPECEGRKSCGSEKLRACLFRTKCTARPYYSNDMLLRLRSHFKTYDHIWKKWSSELYSRNGPDGCIYGKSPNGYMGGELFVSWFKEILIPGISHVRPTV